MKHKNMKKFLALIGMAPLAVLADGTTSAFDTALSDLQTGVTGMIDKIVPVVAAILVALLVFVGLFMAWKFVRKAAGK